MSKAFEIAADGTAWNPERLQASFPLSMQKDFEASVNKMPYEVGIDKDYPAKLRKMINAATVTYFLQNKSIDNVRRTYLKDVAYEDDPGGELRLDRGFRQICLEHSSRIGKVLRAYPALLRREPIVGEWIGDLTLLRIHYSFQRAFAEADKGALFESVAIARMILEQLAWVYAVRTLNDAEKIQDTKTTKCIGRLCERFANIGKLYGWMSNHVHWDYRAHVKVITNDGDFSGAWFATSEFKAIAYAMLITLTSFVFDVFCIIINGYNELQATEELLVWLAKDPAFDPSFMVGQIYGLSEESPDIQTILNIVKVAATDG